MKQGALEKIIFLIIITGLFSSGCSLFFKEPVVIPPIFNEDFSELDPEEFPEKIKQLEDIAQNHESMSVRARAHLYIALAHIHYGNPLPDYSLALKHLDEYIALDPDTERIDEIVIWMSILRDLDSSIRDYDELKKNYELLKQENVRANKDWKYLYQEKKELSKTIEKQKKQLLSLEEKIKKLDSLYLEIEKKKKTKKK
jgi:tetratricopeptide (TPR) repeat protein